MSQRGRERVNLIVEGCSESEVSEGGGKVVDRLVKVGDW